jgi:hypothetical protein
MDEIVRELENLGEHIETAKSEKAREEGRLQEMFRSLESEFKVKTLDKADMLLKDKEEELKDLDKEIQSDYKELRENYEWE